MEPLKEMFNKAWYEQLSKQIAKHHRPFRPQVFIKDVTNGIESLALNQRMRNTSVTLKRHLPADFKTSVEILKKTVPAMPRGYTNIVFPDFVALYGIDKGNDALDALTYFTPFGSSEFAVREFLKKDFDGTIKVMYSWAGDTNEHVRRLASEGSRPRLPWSFKLDEVITDPKLTRPIMERLKADPSLYVRKSVANHLNDFSRAHSDYLMRVVKDWDLKNPHTAWIIKRACRSLIKQGDKRAMALFSFQNTAKVAVSRLILSSKKVKLGGKLDFSFELVSESNNDQKMAVDFVVHYRKSNGSLSPKVFKLKELTLKRGEAVRISKTIQFKELTTRKHYRGDHKLQLQVNGKIKAEETFGLW